MRDFIYAIKKAYEEIYADKIKAKKVLIFLKKESKRLSNFSKKLSNIEAFLYENHWIFPDPFIPNNSNPYNIFLSFLRYGVDEKGDNIRENGKGFAGAFKLLSDETYTLLRYGKDAYKRHDYTCVISLADEYRKLIKDFDKAEDTHVEHNMTNI